MLVSVLIILVCLVIAWAIIAKMPDTPPIPKWVWYALTGVVAIAVLLAKSGLT